MARILRQARRSLLQDVRSGLRDPIDKRTKEGKVRRDRREFMETARERYEMADEADQAQADRETSDLSFYAGNQWPQDVKDARAGQNATGNLPPVPARPCLVINKVREPVSQVLSQLRGADISAELIPADDFEGLGVVLDHKEIELREGMLRRILRESQASNWIYQAGERAAIAGRGYMGVMTRYAPGKTMDQELYVTGWADQSRVKLDPTHEGKDGSGASYGFIGNWVKWQDYKKRWKDSPQSHNAISSMSEKEFIDFGQSEDAKPWFKTSGKLRMVYVVDYFYTVETARDLCQLADGTVEWKDELQTDADVVDTRPVIDVTVKWAKIDGANPEPLEETDWVTPDIPIVKVVGDQLPPFDDDVHCEGLVRPARDSNQGFNAMASKLVETVANTPIPGVMMAGGQDEGFEKEWNLSTTRNVGRLHYNMKDSEGNLVGRPEAVPRDPGPIQPLAMSLAMFDEAVQTTSRRHDPSLGKVDPTLRSGRAIDKIVDQSKEGTSNFGDNLKISVRRLAEILNNGLYPVYGTRPGRLAKIINGENKPQTIMVGKPYTMTSSSSTPQAVSDTHAGAQQYQLTEHANCNIAIKITRNFETRREEEQAMIGAIIAADPSQLAVCGDLFFGHGDGPGSQELAKRYKLMLAPPIQAALAAEEKGQTPLPPQVMQQLALGRQAMEQAQAEIAELKQKIAAKETETTGKVAITHIQEQHEDDRADKDREAKLDIAVLSGKYETLNNAMQLLQTEIARIGSQQQDSAMQRADHAHDVGSKALDHEMATSLSAQDHAQATSQQEQAHGHALTEGLQAAALAPEPSNSGTS